MPVKCFNEMLRHCRKKTPKFFTGILFSTLSINYLSIKNVLPVNQKNDFRVIVVGDISYIPRTIARRAPWLLFRQRVIVRWLQRQLKGDWQVLHCCCGDNDVIRFISLHRFPVR